MNLDNFPTSTSAQRMLSYVTAGWYDNSYVGKWIFEVMGIELDRIADPVEGLAYQAFIDTATWSLKYWEQLVGIPVREDLDYNVRRSLISERMDKYHPINPAWMESFLSKITGRKVEVKENPKTYTFSVRIGNGRNSYSLPLVLKRLDAIKPAHLGYDVTIFYEEEMSLQTGIATNMRNQKSPLSEVDDHMLSMNYLVDEHVNIAPSAKELGELTGYIFLTDSAGRLLRDNKRNILFVKNGGK